MKRPHPRVHTHIRTQKKARTHDKVRAYFFQSSHVVYFAFSDTAYFGRKINFFVHQPHRLSSKSACRIFPTSNTGVRLTIPRGGGCGLQIHPSPWSAEPDTESTHRSFLSVLPACATTTSADPSDIVPRIKQHMALGADREFTVFTVMIVLLLVLQAVKTTEYCHTVF
jgi:hypothetical protein